MPTKAEIVALIPARGGSKRIRGKNLKPLAGVPLVGWTIQAAVDSGCFQDVIVCSDDLRLEAIARMDYGVRFNLRPFPVADDQPDFEWVRSAVQQEIGSQGAFAILRPTSPFRSAATIQRAVQQFLTDEVHSLRAVRTSREHPGKQWCIDNGCLKPWLDRDQAGTPWHSSPTQTLPPSYVQTGGLEIAWTYVLESFGTISGKKISPFLLEGPEALDVNTPEDFAEAERIAAAHPELLPCLTSR